MEDYYHDTYQGAPSDGSAWVEQCSNRVIRGGSWNFLPLDLRSAFRNGGTAIGRYNDLGFRVGRTLTP